MAATWELENELVAQGYPLVAGADEAGRGPLAGPVVAAVVVFSPEVRPLGFDDSKVLSPRLRRELLPVICREALAVGIGVVDSILIDQVNILQATRLAVARAWERLRVKPDFLLLDALKLPELLVPQRGVIDGDALSCSIAAASIVAKEYRDKLMIHYGKKYPLYNFASHKGYPTREHRELLAAHGPCPLHRKSFQGVAGQ